MQLPFLVNVHDLMTVDVKDVLAGQLGFGLHVFANYEGKRVPWTLFRTGGESPVTCVWRS